MTLIQMKIRHKELLKIAESDVMTESEFDELVVGIEDDVEGVDDDEDEAEELLKVDCVLLELSDDSIINCDCFLDSSILYIMNIIYILLILY